MLFSKKDIIKLMIPLIVEQTLAVTIGVADTMMVTQVSEAVVSGVAIVDVINTLLVQVFAALATGGAIITAQYIGKKESDSACNAAKQLSFVVVALGIAVAAVCSIWRVGILKLVYKTVEPDVMQAAQEYFLMTALSYPFFALFSAGAALFRSQGNSAISMLTALMMNILNIGGNALFIFVFNMGAAGAGLGTLIARIIGAAVMVLLLKRPSGVVYIDRFLPVKLQPKMILTILRISIPSGLENGIFHLGKLLVAGLVSSFGTAAISANAAGNCISSMACIPASAIGLGLITIVGQCVGAGEYDQASHYTGSLVKMAYVIGGAVNLPVVLFANQIAALFNLSAEATHYAAVISAIHAGFWLLFWPLAFTLPNALRAAGDVKYTMTVSIVVMWICRIGFSYVFGLYMNMGIIGVWLAMTVDWLVRGVFFVARFRSNRWRTVYVV